MTVAELRRHLESYDPDMPVYTTWEGVVRAIVANDGFEVCLTGDGSKCLLIDAESYEALVRIVHGT